MAVLVGGDILMGLEAMSEEDFLDAAKKAEGKPVFVRGRLGELIVGESLGIGGLRSGGLINGSLVIKDFPVDGRERTCYIPRHNVHNIIPIASAIIARTIDGVSGSHSPSVPSI